MYKLIIVDDDEIICNGLNRNIKWGMYDIQVIGTAFDGELALQMVKEEKPDIIIADINMPFLDGLELAGIIRQEYPEIKMILLTAYEEFEYAKRAVKLQVHEYITKPFDNQKVIESVCAARDDLIKEREVKNKIKDSIPLLKDKYLYELIKGNYNNKKIEEITEFINIPMSGYYFCVCTLYMDNCYSNEVSNLEFSNIVINEFSRQKILHRIQSLIAEQKFVVFKSRDEEITIICKDNVSKESCNNFMDQAICKIYETLEDVDDSFISVGVGRTYFGISYISCSYEEATKACEYRYNFGNKSIIKIDEIDTLDNDCELDIGKKQIEIINNFKIGLIDNVFLILDEIFNSFRMNKNINIPYVQMTALEIIVLVYKSEQIEGISKVFDIPNGIRSEIMKLKKIEEIKVWLKNRFIIINNNELEGRKGGIEKVIDSAIKYININYSNSDLSLTGVANFVHITPSYLSALFIQFKKVNYSDYLTNVRIKSACHLLREIDIKTYEVAFKVGYNSPQYFSVCFKKVTGLTPAEYKIQNTI